MTDATPDPLRTTRLVTFGLAAVPVLIAPLNCAVYFQALDDWGADWFQGFLVFGFLQGLLGFAAMIAGIVYAVRLSRANRSKTPGIVGALVGLSTSLGALLGVGLGMAALAVAAGAGGAWGRPLRIRGRVRHPELRRGDDWTRGDRPDASDLDEPTRLALEALWLHDAQKEHASVPAFARVAWMLVAIGAPADLVERTFRAAQEELEHTRLCFALAAGYGGRSHSVEPMPELLLDGALEVRGNALVHLAVESLKDGCLLQDYNADVAAECARVCEEPVTRAVLERIAIEERDHAELSWSILGLCLERGGEVVARAIAEAKEELVAYERPTAVSGEKLELVGRADAVRMRQHGRLPDEEWARIYAARLSATVERLEALVLSSGSELSLREVA